MCARKGHCKTNSWKKISFLLVVEWFPDLCGYSEPTQCVSVRAHPPNQPAELSFPIHWPIQDWLDGGLCLLAAFPSCLAVLAEDAATSNWSSWLPETHTHTPTLTLLQRDWITSFFASVVLLGRDWEGGVKPTKVHRGLWEEWIQPDEQADGHGQGTGTGATTCCPSLTATVMTGTVPSRLPRAADVALAAVPRLLRSCWPQSAGCWRRREGNYWLWCCLLTPLDLEQYLHTIHSQVYNGTLHFHTSICVIYKHYVSVR